VEGHHIHHWAHGGETKLSNLLTLCKHHHRLVHEGGVSIQRLDDGALRFVRSDGKSFDNFAPKHTQCFKWTDVTDANETAGASIDERTAVSRYDGNRVDYGACIDVLLQRSRRGNVSAEMQKS